MNIKFLIQQALAVAFVFNCLLGNAEERQDYITKWSVALGSTAPAISAKDAQGRLRSFENLKLEHGLLLFVNRSADW